MSVGSGGGENSVHVHSVVLALTLQRFSSAVEEHTHTHTHTHTIFPQLKHWPVKSKENAPGIKHTVSLNRRTKAEENFCRGREDPSES